MRKQLRDLLLLVLCLGVVCLLLLWHTQCAHWSQGRLFERMEIGASADTVMEKAGREPDAKATLPNGRELWWYLAPTPQKQAHAPATVEQMRAYAGEGRPPGNYLDVVVVFSPQKTVEHVELCGEGGKPPRTDGWAWWQKLK